MYKPVMKHLGWIAFVLLASINTSYAADPDIPSLNPDEGRVGELRRIPDPTEFKVCADPDLLPHSNNKQEGFEDKIAELLAKDLGKKLSFTYAYNRQGFLRNTINANRCDIIMPVMMTIAPCGLVLAILPPIIAPRIMASTVEPSIQPLALTSLLGGSNSVKIPYFAGE